MPVLLGLRKLTPPAPLGYRYYRLSISANNGGSLTALAELYLRTSPGGPQAAVGGVASASSEYNATFHAGLAFDGDPASDPYWATADGQPAPSWLMYDFGAGNAKQLAEYAIVARPASHPNATPRDWVLEASHDGVTWQQLDSQTGESGWTNGEARAYPLQAGGATQLALPIASAADDWYTFHPHTAGYFNSTNGTDNNRAGHLYVGPQGRTFLRYALPVPKGATILSAHVTSLPYSNRAAAGDIIIRAHAHPDAPPASNASQAQALLDDATSASVVWACPATEFDVPVDSADIASVIQELVDHPDWTNGSYVTLLFTSPGGGAANADLTAYEDGPEYACVLHLEYQ